MKTSASPSVPQLSPRLQPKRSGSLSKAVLSALLPAFLLAAFAPMAHAATPAPRIAGEINSSQMSALPNSKNPHAAAQNDTGRLAATTKLQGMTIAFTRTPSQEADLQALMQAQQTPGSAQYHQWLTPEQFGARFGLADADIAKVQTWLEQQGFSVDSVARGKTMIRFSGTAAQAERAFSTEIHNYSVKTTKGVETHFAPSTAISVPAAMAGVVESVHNLDSFRPHSHLVANLKKHPKPAFSGGSDDSIYFAPGDIATQYDITKAYNSGYTGTGQNIAIVGQSEIAVADIEAFQTAAGLTVKDPQLVLVPNSGTPAFSSGDETESDLDLEWSGAIAKGATITLVYTGNSDNNGAFDALSYAIDQKIAPIISSSYGTCETDLAGFSLETYFSQAATQGQTVISAAGDSGSTDCYGETGLTTAQQEALAVDYPGSSPNVTSVGGTEISQANSAYETQGSAYWTAASGTADVLTSLLQPVPEQAWNEDQAFCLFYLNEGYGGSPICAGGGGASTLFTKPTWQTGVTGIPADGKRDVPDISLNAAIYNPGYLFCTSDQSDWQTDQVASCNSGFRDATSQDVTAAGGTSFAAPIFAGMVAIINQQQNYTSGQGLLNKTLYSLASNSTTYASAFHDITTGNNDCDAGSDYCNGTIGFAAGTGYDQATGLGTIDLFNLAAAFPANTGAVLIDTTTTVTASNAAPTVNTSVNFTISVSSDTGSTIPTGTVNVSVDGAAAVAETLSANGTYVYAATFTTAGAHTVLASYQGDATHASSTGSASVNVAVTTSGTGTIALAATNATIAQGSSGTSTVTVTPSGGYTGTVVLNVTASSNDLANVCATYNNIAVSGTAAVTGTISIDTNAANCLATGNSRKRITPSIRAAGFGSGRPGPIATLGILAGLLLAGYIGRYSRKMRVFAGVLLLATLGLTFTGCGNSNNNSVSNAPKGTYTLTVTGQDASSSTITATTTFTLTIN